MKVETLQSLVAKGEEVWVKVLDIRPDPGGYKVSASMRLVAQDTGEDLDPAGAAAVGPGRGSSGRETDDPPEVGTVHKATVASVQPYGVFVRLEGYRKNGLVHSSQVSDGFEFTKETPDDAKVAAISGVLAVGDPCYVKVLEVKKDEATGKDKVACSIKLVAQSGPTAGTDLDPTGLSWAPRGDGPGGGGGGRAPVGADAAAIAPATGVVNWGYLGADVKQMGDRSYEFVGGDDGEPRPPGPPPLPGTAGAGLGAGVGAGAGAVTIGSIEEALAILQRHKQRKEERRAKKAARREAKAAKKKERKEGKEGKAKDKKDKGDKGEKKKKRAKSSSESSSDSD